MCFIKEELKDIAVENRGVKSKLKNKSFIVIYNLNKNYKYIVIRVNNEYIN